MIKTEIYVVQKGDTIWDIARMFGVSPERIIADNGLVNPNVLVVGQALIILLPKEIYTVQRNDTLNSIAEKFNTTVISLIQNNPELVRNPLLRVGQILTINFKTDKTRNITINGYAYPFINLQVLRRTLPYLTKITIFGYGFTEDGQLIEINDEPIIRMAYNYQVAPIMLLSSITEYGTFSGERASYLFNNKNAQNALITEIINMMKYKGYLGLDVDFEYINQKDAQAYLDFLRNITEQLNKEGFSVNVDLAPKVSATQEGLLYEAHNYPEIGKIVNTVLLMTYEWGYTYVLYDISYNYYICILILFYNLSTLTSDEVYSSFSSSYNIKSPFCIKDSHKSLKAFNISSTSFCALTIWLSSTITFAI